MFGDDEEEKAAPPPPLPPNGLFSTTTTTPSITKRSKRSEQIDLDMDMIIPNLYLGSLEAAENHEQLKRMNITRILTLLETPLDDQVHRHFKYLFKQVVDAHWSDLLSILDECIEFIHEGVATDSTGVLVHWLE